MHPLNRNQRVIPIIRSWAVAGLLSCFVIAAAPSHAQDTHSVEIQDGVVRVDGKRIPQSELPPTLNVDGVTAHMQFSGGARFEFGGFLYGIDAGRVVEIPDGERSSIVLFFDGSDGRTYRVRAPRAETRAEDGAMRAYSEALGARAVELDKLGNEASSGGLDPNALIRRMRDEANTAAHMVRAFPRVEMQSYLDDLQQRDSSLYERMVREHRMELESRQLADEIRSVRTDAERTRIRTELEEKLAEMFELKQKNRQAEIEQLESQLRDLREQVDARERNRQAIIDRRLQQLIDGDLR